ncbi:60S ribosomal protein L2, mitochondrial [Sesamum angolense]|uniref:60S ribosomal protein L2, mitochondrial n=1 Tax=Sesamum angolense TaxID=2727404 RepID=A0AAE2BJP6_9LAMI|nr:60S ribosomal protein L2, mitochondrial [Sesamum angolense]
MALFRTRLASSTLLRSILHTPSRSLSSVAVENVESKATPSWKSMMAQMLTQDISSHVGSCMPLSNMRIGTIIHNIEIRPGQGGKLVRAAGTSAKILTEPTGQPVNLPPLCNTIIVEMRIPPIYFCTRYCEIKLPSGVKKLIDKRCSATIGTVSNPEHGTKKLRKAGQSRWLGRRPVVRGVAMNPVDHPHGGGEGRSKSSGSHGRVSLTPWGKPTKCGYKTARLKKRM